MPRIGMSDGIMQPIESLEDWCFEAVICVTEKGDSRNNLHRQEPLKGNNLHRDRDGLEMTEAVGSVEGVREHKAVGVIFLGI